MENEAVFEFHDPGLSEGCINDIVMSFLAPLVVIIPVDLNLLFPIYVLPLRFPCA